MSGSREKGLRALLCRVSLFWQLFVSITALLLAAAASADADARLLVAARLGAAARHA